MFDITTFLIRWIFLSNLARDVAEIQTLPVQPYYPHQQPAAQQHAWDAEAMWRDHCIRGILSHPPGSHRVYLLDALRVEAVKQLAQKLKQSDDTMAQQRISREYSEHHHGAAEAAANPSNNIEKEDEEDDENDPFLDADVEIVNSFREEDETINNNSGQDNGQPPQTTTSREASPFARLVISKDGTNMEVDDEEKSGENGNRTHPRHNHPCPPPITDLYEASRCLLQIREYLPQLVSAVLKSPPAFDPHLVDPVQLLRQILLMRCLQDPSWGIELCWLLEAEVGRAWKTLFEHRQQTGRRLIVVLPADKAAVLAKIGSEKRGAFDFLQDAEQATAYGYTDSVFTNVLDNNMPSPFVSNDQQPPLPRWAPRLPSSISLRRCSHFGDTMHFIDRLTKISLDLRAVPVVQRTVRTQAEYESFISSGTHPFLLLYQIRTVYTRHCTN